MSTERPNNWPTGPYDVILADPPWFYRDRRNGGSKFGGGAQKHYPVMKLDELLALPVVTIAAPRSVLFMWTTFPRLEWALAVMKAWGFKYRTLGFSWIKTNRKSGGYYFGVGFYAKSNAEVCLLGTRGRPLHPATNGVSSAIVSPLMQHSRKPDEARRRIELMYPDARKIELFAREQPEGWDVWGNQVERFVWARQESLFVAGR